MSQSPGQFAKLLSRAVQTIKLLEGKPIAVIQDELGHQLGRPHGSCINYWRKGNVPADPVDTINLARALMARNGLTTEGCEQFLQYAGCGKDPELLHRADSYIALPQNDPLQPGQTQFLSRSAVTFPETFIGRARELGQLCTYLGALPLQSVLLTGPARSGKTSLLYKLNYLLNHRDGHQWPGSTLAPQLFYQTAYIDLSDPRLREINMLLSTILLQIGLPAPARCSIKEFINFIVDGIYQPTVILIDEIQMACEYAFDDLFWWGLRGLCDHLTGGRLAVVITGRDIKAETLIQFPHLHRLYELLAPLELRPLSEGEAAAYLDSMTFPIETEDREWILTHSGRWPVLLQILCRCYYMYHSGRSTSPWREQALARADRVAL